MTFHISASWETLSFKSSIAEMMIPTKRDWRIITEKVIKTKKYHAAIHPTEKDRGKDRVRETKRREK
jgi:hypothetical protein